MALNERSATLIGSVLKGKRVRNILKRISVEREMRKKERDERKETIINRSNQNDQNDTDQREIARLDDEEQNDIIRLDGLIEVHYTSSHHVVTRTPTSKSQPSPICDEWIENDSLRNGLDEVCFKDETNHVHDSTIPSKRMPFSSNFSTPSSSASSPFSALQESTPTISADDDIFEPTNSTRSCLSSPLSSFLATSIPGSFFTSAWEERFLNVPKNDSLNQITFLSNELEPSESTQRKKREIIEKNNKKKRTTDILPNFLDFDQSENEESEQDDFIQSQNTDNTETTHHRPTQTIHTNDDIIESIQFSPNRLKFRETHQKRDVSVPVEEIDQGDNGNSQQEKKEEKDTKTSQQNDSIDEIKQIEKAVQVTSRIVNPINVLSNSSSFVSTKDYRLLDEFERENDENDEIDGQIIVKEKQQRQNEVIIRDLKIRIGELQSYGDRKEKESKEKYERDKTPAAITISRCWTNHSKTILSHHLEREKRDEWNIQKKRSSSLISKCWLSIVFARTGKYHYFIRFDADQKQRANAAKQIHWKWRNAQWRNNCKQELIRKRTDESSQQRMAARYINECIMKIMRRINAEIEMTRRREEEEKRILENKRREQSVQFMFVKCIEYVIRQTAIEKMNQLRNKDESMRCHSSWLIERAICKDTVRKTENGR